MRQPRFFLGASLCAFLMTASCTSFADTQDSTTSTFTDNSTAAFSPFTGKVTRNKVRMRLQPSLDGKILRELNRDDLLVVLGETEEFYAVQPPADTKAYVYRTFVLDNVIEANKVNVRTEPDLEAPILVQLSQGDRVEGSISPLNSKWLEIAAPSNARYYICKEYVEKLGAPSLMAELKRRREEVNQLLNTAYLTSQSELQKPYEQINIEPILATFSRIIRDYSDFSEQAARAKEFAITLQDNYLQRKIAYLETKASRISTPTEVAMSSPAIVAEEPQEPSQPVSSPVVKNNTPEPNAKMSSWLPVEDAYYSQWSAANDQGSEEEFLREEAQQAVTLRGVIELYARPVKNKPGDYLLVNRSNHLPIAYLYSTTVNLQDMLGQEVTIHAVTRPNNNFAFPAYKVLSTE